jgi:hypothetical protein
VRIAKRVGVFLKVPCFIGGCEGFFWSSTGYLLRGWLCPVLGLGFRCFKCCLLRLKRWVMWIFMLEHENEVRCCIGEISGFCE